MTGVCVHSQTGNVLDDIAAKLRRASGREHKQVCGCRPERCLWGDYHPGRDGYAVARRSDRARF